MLSKKSGHRNLAVSVIALSLGLVASGCTKTSETSPGKTETTTSTATSTSTSTTTSTGTSTATTTSTSTTTGATTPSEAKKEDANKVETGIPEATQPDSNPNHIPVVEAVRRKIKLGKIPDSQIILTVGETPITIGMYRQQLRNQEEQIQTNLSADDQLRSQLMQDAKQNKVYLTADEKKRLLDQAKKAEKATGNVLKDHLKATHQTTEQFNQYVLDMGLAFKDAVYRVEQQLLHELVDREILVGSARTNGFGPAAFNTYMVRKKSDAFKALIKQGVNGDTLRDQIIENELVERMTEKIKKEAKVTDADVQKFYDENKSHFKHGEQLRLSQILIAAPSKDLGPLQSVRTQIKSQNPKISEAELDGEVKIAIQHQKQRAAELLAKALKGEDFAKLANENTDDLETKAAKLGGDMGLHDKDQLLKAIVEKIDKLKVGQVYPDIIETPFGFHVVKLTDQKPAGITPLADIKPTLTEMLQHKKSDEALKNWLAEKRKTVTITVSPEFKALIANQANQAQH